MTDAITCAWCSCRYETELPTRDMLCSDCRTRSLQSAIEPVAGCRHVLRNGDVTDELWWDKQAQCYYEGAPNDSLIWSHFNGSTSVAVASQGWPFDCVALYSRYNDTDNDEAIITIRNEAMRRAGGYMNARSWARLHESDRVFFREFYHLSREHKP